MKFVPNLRFESLWQRSQDAEQLQEEIADEIAERVKQIAPRDTGDYINSIEVVDGQVITTDPAGHIIEWGSLDTPTHAPLRRGAEQIVGTDHVR
jgi:hypothetical protein